MKKITFLKIFLFTGIFVFLAIPNTLKAQTYGSNLVLNPGFEDAVNTAWTAGPNNTSISTTNFISGTKSAVYSNVNNSQYGSYYQLINVIAGATYKFGFTGRALDAGGPSGGTCTAPRKLVGNVKRDNSTGTVLTTLDIISGTNTTVNSEFTIPSGVTQVYINTTKGFGVCYVDDILLQLKQWNIATSVNNVAMGTVSGGGLTDPGTSVSLVATPSPGYCFVNWTEDGSPISTNASLPSFTASADRTIVANFALISTLTVTGALSPFSSTYGTASTTQSFTVAGTSLTTDIVITPPTNFEISLTSGSGFQSTALSLTPVSNSVATTTIYVRLKSPVNAANYSAANITINTTGSSEQTVSCSGTVAKKALSISGTSIAPRNYNGLNTTGTITIGTITGFVGTETVTATATGIYPSPNVWTGQVGTIVYTLVNGLNGGLASNYSLANSTAYGNITSKQLNLVVAAQSVAYGTAGSTLTAAGSYTLSGFVNGETAATAISGTATYTTSYTNTTAAGTSGVTITQSAGLTIVNGNYWFSRTAGTITIVAQNTVTVPAMTAQILGNLTTDIATNLAVNNTGTLTVNASSAVNSVTIESGGKLNVSSPLTAGTVVFKAGKEATASATPSANTFSTKLDANIIATSVRVYKTIDDLKWYFMSFPCDVNVSEITNSIGGSLGTLGAGGDWFIKFYDGQNRATNGVGSNWKHIAEQLPDPTKLLANKGYIFGLKTEGATYDVELSIPLAASVLLAETDGRTVPVTHFTGSVGATNNGWNLVGQPYMSNFNGNGKTTAAFMSFPDGNNATYSQISNAENYYIPPTGAYFVQVESGTAITFDKLGRQTVKSTVANDLSDRVQLNFVSATGVDKTNFIMDNAQSTAYEIGQDLEKMIGTGSDKPQVYSTMSGINYAYNALPMSSINNLPIGIYTKTAGTTTISVDATQAPSLSKLLLTDNGVVVADLLTSNYTFTAAAGTNNSRFAITAQRITTENNVIRNNQGEIQLLIDNSRLVIKNLNYNTTVRVYDALGRMIISKNGNSNAMEIKLNAKGIYTVQLQNGTTISTRKVIL